MASQTIIETKGLGKQFGDFQAVIDVNYRVLAGDAVGIIGPNGAGKSTFFNLLTGLFPPTSGSIHFFGQDVSNLSAENRVALGMVRTFQLVSVLDSLMVLDNLVLAVIRCSADFNHKMSLMMGSAHPKHIIADCAMALESVGLASKAHWPTSDLSYGDKRMLEIAMALSLKPKLLLLDEPLAGLSEAEIAEVVKLIDKVKKNLTVVIIEHKISRIVNLVSRLSVMHEGRLIAEGEPDDILCDPLVREVYWGERNDACEVTAAGE